MDNQVVRVVVALCEDVGTPRASLVKRLVQEGKWAELQELRCRPQDYTDSESYWADAVVTDILRKCDLPSSVDREKAAVRTFYECELQNARTNVRLSRFLPDSLFLEGPDGRVSDFISHWRKEISSVLGHLPDSLTPRFSRGATYADTGKLITAPDKMSSTPTIYQKGRCILPLWGRTAWARSLIASSPNRSDPRTVRGNIFFTVPKDGTKFRGCCKEASLNVAYQLDVGRLMKLRLERIGIDLRQGQTLHRTLARESSVKGHLATIDMSNASDTLCRVLPKLVLPGQWWELLDSLRAERTRIEGSWVRLEKFSSMGNGFTFELETLIFATLARTVILLSGGKPSEVSCYGDDLIVPSEHYRSVMAGLQLFGFTPNMKKTFAEGPFRESCGGDYWGGVPVRAHFLENLPDEPQHWISLANGLRRVSLGAGSISRWNTVLRAWHRCLDQLPTAIRACRGPEHLGDVVIHDDPENWIHTLPPDWCDPTWDQTFVRAYVPVPVTLPWSHWKPTVQLACCTLGYPSDGISPRGEVAGFRISRINARLRETWTPITSSVSERGVIALSGMDVYPLTSPLRDWLVGFGE